MQLNSQQVSSAVADAETVSMENGIPTEGRYGVPISTPGRTKMIQAMPVSSNF